MTLVTKVFVEQPAQATPVLLIFVVNSHNIVNKVDRLKNLVIDSKMALGTQYNF